MGLFDWFKKSGDPAKDLMRMDERRLLEYRATVEVDLEDAGRKVEARKKAYEQTIETASLSSSPLEQKRLATKASLINEEVVLLERDHEGLLKAQKLVHFLLNARRGLGSRASSLEGQLRGIMGLSGHEFELALNGLAKKEGIAMERMQSTQRAVSDYTASSASVEEDPPELALIRERAAMRAHAEPARAAPAKAVPAERPAEERSPPVEHHAPAAALPPKKKDTTPEMLEE